MQWKKEGENEDNILLQKFILFVMIIQKKNYSTKF